MRNLKKFLALVLAMLMAFSLMVTVNAASEFTDAENITDEFFEGVQVLEGLKVFTGYTNGDKFDFRPKNSITRAEVATIVYRLATGDVEGKQAHLYADYQKFDDVKSDHWAAGYINYCANAEWIAGYGNGKFGPNDSVTGYQAAAMILRAVGYGKNNEFTGPSWQVQVANVTRSQGLLKNVDKTTYANTLNKAAPRELVAEILFQAGLINTVRWTMLNGYEPEVRADSKKANGLAWQNFELNVGDFTVIDKWGRPGYYWYKNNTNNKTNRVATIEYKPVLEFDTTWKECDVAHELEIDTNEDNLFQLYVNNYKAITDQYRIEPTDTVTRVGGQGRITEFYSDITHPYKTLYGGNRANWTQSVTMIDTYLATVTRVTERVLDPAGHVITPAYLYLDVYDGHGVGPALGKGVYFASGSTAKVNTTAHRASDTEANWTYAVGDKVLVQGYTDYYQWENAGSVSNGGAPAKSLAEVAGYTLAGGTVVGIGDNLIGTTGLNHVDAWGGYSAQANKEKAAFETNSLRASGNGNNAYYYDDLAYDKTGSVALDVVGKAEVKIGKQTVTYWNEAKHTVDGTDYNDALTLYLDEAKTTTGTNFAWCFDLAGNLIGIDKVPNTVSYGVITNIYSAFGQGDNSQTTGTAKAIASVKYADGTTGTLTIDKFLMGANGFGPATAHNTPGTAMTGVGNVLDLLPVYDNASGSVMTTSGPRINNTAANQGWLHVAPVSAVNANEQGQNTGNYLGVLCGNLFKFVASGNDTVTAIEVAGDNGNAASYYGHYNEVTTASGAKLSKNYGYITLDGTSATADVRLDPDAKIMIRSSATSNSVSCFTLNNLPGDVALYWDAATGTGSEVDWVDVNDDGRAEYVYVVGTSQGTLTYGLFYYNGGAAQWNGVEKTGTIVGWLNGDPATLTFRGETNFNRVRDSQDYKGHLFAIQMTNGVVSAVMNDSTGSYKLLDVAGNKITGGFDAAIGIGAPFMAGTTTMFGLGSQNSSYGNPYTQNTEALYVKDTGTNVTYDAYSRTVTIGGDIYYLNATSKVVGLGMGVNQETAILDYLNQSTTNDVTVVYEYAGVRSIVEIYVATDPNVTPGTPDVASGVLSIGTVTHDGSTQFTVPFTSDMVLTKGGNYANINVLVEKWDGSSYVTIASGLANENVAGVDFAAADVTADTAKTVTLNYAPAAAGSLAGTYRVSVGYTNSLGNIVAFGSAIRYVA